MIPRQAIFGAPDKFQFRLSPDGKEMSYLAPENGVLNIWVAPRGNFAAARALTHETKEGINFHVWARDSKTILFRADATGGEDWHIYEVDAASGAARDLTPFDGAEGDILALSNAHPDEALLSINKRDPRFPDAYLADLATGKLTLAEQNPGYSHLVPDNDFNIRFAVAPTVDGGLALFQKTDTGWSPAGTVDAQDALTFRFLGFENTNKRLYLIDSRGRDTAALTRFTPSTGETEVLGQDDKADISGVLVHPSLLSVQAFTVTYERPQWRVIDEAVEDDLKALAAAAGPQGTFDIVDRTLDDATWVVHIDKVTEPGAYYLYDTKTRALHFLFTTRPALKNAPLVPMHTALIKARDGRELVAYYSLPRGADANADGKPEARSPLVIVVHGGPWARDKYGFNEWHQWLANRGYAVLSVNFRGSTGFGKAFLNAGNGEWGGAMLSDLADGAAWAVAQGIAKPGKIAILGGQYGGYAALASLAFFPSEYACGVALSAPVNLADMMKTLPPYWTGMKEMLRQRVGDPETASGLALLKAQSPGLHAAAISRPLLIAEGANDPEVSEDDTQAFVRTLKDKGVAVTYALYPDEGEMIVRPADQMSFYAMTEAFLGKCLGGRSEGFGDALKGASLQIVDGAALVPGLAKAIDQLGTSKTAP